MLRVPRLALNRRAVRPPSSGRWCSREKVGRALHAGEPEENRRSQQEENRGERDCPGRRGPDQALDAVCPAGLACPTLAAVIDTCIQYTDRLYCFFGGIPILACEQTWTASVFSSKTCRMRRGAWRKSGRRQRTDHGRLPSPWV